MHTSLLDGAPSSPSITHEINKKKLERGAQHPPVRAERGSDRLYGRGLQQFHCNDRRLIEVKEQQFKYNSNGLRYLQE